MLSDLQITKFYPLINTLITGEEAAAAQAVARTAQAEAAKAVLERDAAKRLVAELKTQVAAAERAQDRLDALNVRFLFGISQ